MLKTVSSITNAIGALNYKGAWNASTNTPTITSSVGVKGDYYQVSVAGSTAINGISNWGVGDSLPGQQPVRAPHHCCNNSSDHRRRR
jgi:hypothetical protein